MGPGEHQVEVEWVLESGTWRSAEYEEGFEFEATPQNNPVSKALSLGDIKEFFATSGNEGQSEHLFPPEFNYSPFSGRPLIFQPAQPGYPWIGPHGATSVNSKSKSLVRGLRQTDLPIVLSKPIGKAPEDPPEATLPLPPPGLYEFLSIPLGTQAPVLLAVEPHKGALFVFLEDSRRWDLLENSAGGFLAEIQIERSDWRCEVVLGQKGSRIFLPSSHGLAIVEIDAAALSFTVKYVGDAKAAGSPVKVGDYVWIPIEIDGQIRLLSADTEGKAGPIVEISELPKDWGQIHAPIANQRMALWPTKKGQLVLRSQPNGSFIGRFIAWPSTVSPQFNFGSPYLSKNGSFWQLCFSEPEEKYCYVELGLDDTPTEYASAPRFCTGSTNYRVATKAESDPWVDPEFGDDGSNTELIIPLLESSLSKSVVGLRVQSSESLASVLDKTDRMRAIVQVEDTSKTVAFYSFNASEPWAARLFMHREKLWLYHPQERQISGWGVEK